MMLENNKLIGFAGIPFPVFMLPMMGMTHMANPASESNKALNTMKEPRWLFAGSR